MCIRDSSGPAEIFRERFAAARDSYETWLECANRAEAAGEACLLYTSRCV